MSDGVVADTKNFVGNAAEKVSTKTKDAASYIGEKGTDVGHAVKDTTKKVIDTTSQASKTFVDKTKDVLNGKYWLQGFLTFSSQHTP